MVPNCQQKASNQFEFFLKFHLVLSQSYGAIYKQKELLHMLHSKPIRVYAILQLSSL